MHIFYTPDISGDTYTLPLEESKHCIKVLRLQQGDGIILVNGKGLFCEAIMENTDVKGCRVKVVKRLEEYGKRNFKLHIAVAPTKNIDRIEWLLEKCTEIGVDKITMLITDHSERKIVKPERLEKIMIAAMKQSQKAYLPELTSVVSSDTFILTEGEKQRFIAHCHPGDKKRLDEVYQLSEDAVILIGPEGDFSEREVKMAEKQGFIPITLGNSRLRTETAGIVACHTINFLNEMQAGKK